MKLPTKCLFFATNIRDLQKHFFKQHLKDILLHKKENILQIKEIILQTNVPFERKYFFSSKEKEIYWRIKVFYSLILNKILRFLIENALVNRQITL
jgi:hypothetical protein